MCAAVRPTASNGLLTTACGLRLRRSSVCLQRWYPLRQSSRKHPYSTAVGTRCFVQYTPMAITSIAAQRSQFSRYFFASIHCATRLNAVMPESQ